MGVPFIDIKRFEPGFLAEWQQKVAALSQEARFIGGEEVANLEKSLAEYTSTKLAITCANGTDALQLALRAIGIERGDKVLLPDSTFWATYEAIVNVGATPYTVDTNPDDLQMDFTSFEQAIAEIQPKAAILVHLYGWGSGRLNEFRQLCRDKDVALLEDGAQCFGVEYQKKPIYQEALIATTSFYPAKVFGAAGDAGAVFCSNEELADKTRKLANHGRDSHYGHGMVGWNSRMDSLQAAYLNLSLKHFATKLASRREFARKYRQDLQPLGVRCIEPPPGYEENGYCNVTLFANETRTALQEELKKAGIGFANIYPGAMSDQPGAAKYLGKKFGGNHAATISSTVLNLPLFPYMTEEEYKLVIDTVHQFVKNHGLS